MITQHSWRLCANLRAGRKPAFAALQNVLVLMVCVCLGCAKHADERVACPAIEMSGVADVQSDSTRPVKMSDGTTIALARTPLVTSADITGGHASQAGGQWVLNVDVTDEAAKRVQEFTKQHVGGMVAVLLDGKVRSTPRIKDPVTGKGFMIGEFEHAEAERLATAISGGCKQ